MFRVRIIPFLTLSFLIPKVVSAQTPIELDRAQTSLIQNTFVATPMAGVVEAVVVSEGDRVAAGDALVRLDAEQIRTELDAARAALEAAQIQAKNDVDRRYAERTLDVRRRELEQSVIANESFAGAISRTEIAKQKLVVDQAQLAIEQAKHDQRVNEATAREKMAAVKIVEARLSNASIRSPVDGIVVEIAAEPGEYVEVGKPIVRVISIDPIRVEVLVDGQRHGPDLVGKVAEFFPTTEPKRGYRGEVSFVSPELEPVTGQTRLWATIKNPDGTLRAGLRGRLMVRPSGPAQP